MPVPSNPVLEDVMMTPGRLRSLRLRMKKYHTDFGSAVVTQTIVTPKANIYACGPEPFAFKIIAGFENPIGTSDGHSRNDRHVLERPRLESNSRVFREVQCPRRCLRYIHWYGCMTGARVTIANRSATSLHVQC